MRSVCLALMIGTVACATDPAVTPLAPYEAVDVFIGTGGGFFGQGQAFPGATVPFGMVKPGPDTGGYLPRAVTGFAHTAGYWYADDQIEGFSQLHLHGTGVEDYGTLLLQPTLGMDASKTDEEGYSQHFSHETEVGRPGYYAVTLEESDLRVELGATAHAAIHRYTRGAGDGPTTVIADITHAIGGVGRVLDANATFDRTTGELSGELSSAGRFTGTAQAFGVYFSVRFDPPPTGFGAFSPGQVTIGEASVSGADAGMVFDFGRQPVVHARVGMSYIDVAQARQNRQEVENASLEEIVEAAATEWRAMLERVEVEGGTPAERTIFYSALYHCMLMPTSMTEGGRYRGLDREIHDSPDFTFYSDMSLWDTFRTLHPLLTLLAPAYAHDFAVTLVKQGEQNGGIPRWPLAVNETGTMLGSPGAIVLAETVLKGATDLDAQEVLDALVADARGLADRSIRPAACVEHAYCPADLIGRSVSHTLEYAWADSAIARLAKRVDHTELAREFELRSHGYRHLWDPESGFFRGRNLDGSWASRAFDATAFTDDYAEGNAWQYLWATPFDLTGTLELFGSREVLLDRLDEFFYLSATTPTPTVLEDDFLGMDTYYWHGNEPDIHAPYLYAMAGAAERGARWIEWVRTTKYAAQPNGLVGNDDGGTLSAWYVFSALGLYPLAGSDRYVLGVPVFERATLHLPSGPLQIVAHQADGSASLDGRSLGEPWISHEQLLGGRHLVLGAARRRSGLRPN